MKTCFMTIGAIALGSTAGAFGAQGAGAQAPPQLPPPAAPVQASLPPSPGAAGIATPHHHGRAAVTQNGYMLAFADADVKRVLDAVLGSMLRLEYSVDPKVIGTVTLRTTKAVPASELLPLLENALAPIDAVIVQRGTSYRVVLRSDARASAPMADSSSGVDETTGFATEVIQLKAASARSIAAVLTQYLGKDAVAGADDSTSQIILSGTADERAMARKIVARFDVDTFAGATFEFFRLENVDADTIVSDLGQIFQPPYDIIGTRVRLVALPRLHSILAIARDKSDIARVEPWIKKLDVGNDAAKRKVYDYTVQNGRARDLAVSLQLVLGGGDTAPVPGFGPNAPAAGGTAQQAGFTPTEPAQSVAPQSPLPGSSTPILTPVGGGGGGNPGAPRIVPDDGTNSLLIYATGEEYDFIHDVLTKLDRPVPQVLIEATLAEVTLTNDLNLGIDWSVISGKSTFTSSSTGSGIPASVFPGFSWSYIGNSARAVLNTLQSRTTVRVLSAPKILVLDNKTATLQVGDQVPIVTGQSQSVTAAGAPIVNSIELHDTGVILKVTPRVNDSGAVTMDISQQVSEVAQTTTSGINSPTIQQRLLESTVVTRSGQMVALGGLIRESTTLGRSGFPLLSQLPVIGAAFGQQTRNRTRTELIILITPVVMRSMQDAGEGVDELFQGLEQTRKIVYHETLDKRVGASPVKR